MLSTKKPTPNRSRWYQPAATVHEPSGLLLVAGLLPLLWIRTRGGGAAPLAGSRRWW
jgi:hypothetical protein